MGWCHLYKVCVTDAGDVSASAQLRGAGGDWGGSVSAGSLNKGCAASQRG